MILLAKIFNVKAIVTLLSMSECVSKCFHILIGNVLIFS